MRQEKTEKTEYAMPLVHGEAECYTVKVHVHKIKMVCEA
jgi:hypothetical protein